MSIRLAAVTAVLGYLLTACSGGATAEDGGTAGGTAAAGGGRAGGSAGGTAGGATAGGAAGGATAGGTAGGADAGAPAPSGLRYATQPATYRVGTAIAPNVPSLDAGGLPVSFFVNGGLPLGLTLDGLSGVITGTPQVAVPAAPYRVLAMTAGGSTFTDLVMTVNDRPRSLSYVTNPAVYRWATAIAPNVPAFDGGGLPVTFFIADGGPLPNGLLLDAGTGVISGTPLARTLPATWTIGVGNDAGSATVDVSIAVYDPPFSITYADDPVLYARGVPVQVPNVPTVTGVTGPVNFTGDSGTTALPAGLVVDPVLGTIAGTPTVLVTNAFPTLRVSNAFGSAAVQIRVDIGAAATLTVTPPGNMLQVGIVNFGPGTYNLTGQVVLGDDGVGVATDGCESFVNNVVGRVVLVDRTPNCAATTPALRGQAGGAVLVLIADNQPDAGIARNLYLQNGAVQIPALIITQADGAALKAALLAGPVTATAVR